MNHTEQPPMQGIARNASDIARIEGKIDAYIQSHQMVHTTVDSHRLPDRVRSLEDWRLEWQAYGRLLKITFGTSAVAAVTGLLGILLILQDLGLHIG